MKTASALGVELVPARPSIENNTGLTFRQENVLLIFKDNQLAALELQNGILKRYIVKEADRADSMSLFDADKPAQHV